MARKEGKRAGNRTKGECDRCLTTLGTGGGGLRDVKKKETRTLSHSIFAKSEPVVSSSTWLKISTCQRNTQRRAREHSEW